MPEDTPLLMPHPKLPSSLPERMYFFRHGQSIGNARELDDNSLKTLANHQFPLTLKGKEQTHELAKYILGEKILSPYEEKILSQCEEIYVTNFLRTQMSLENVLCGGECALPVYQDSRLDEWWKGIYHSLGADERQRYYPGEEEIMQRERWYHYRPPQGESGKDVELRLLSFLKDLHNVPLISGHGRIGGFLDRLLCKRDLDLDCNYPIPRNGELWLFSKNGDFYTRTSLFVPEA
jgi:broad specificity phosphatase PhoE